MSRRGDEAPDGCGFARHGAGVEGGKQGEAESTRGDRGPGGVIGCCGVRQAKVLPSCGLCVRIGRMKKLLLSSLLMLCLLPVADAQSVDVTNQERDVVRVLRHPDGTRSIYKRQAGWRGMRCATYTASGKLAAINDYTEGKYGQLMGCHIYDSGRNLIYKVSYGYDQKARLIEERMYSHPDMKLVQRVIYKYDAGGKRSKPLIISLNPNAASIAPTLGEDAARIHQEMSKQR